MVEIAILTETKTTDINAGTFTSGSWIVRLLNNLVSNQTTGWISLNSITGAGLSYWSTSSLFSSLPTGTFL